jgi:hypothetical protein
MMARCQLERNHIRAHDRLETALISIGSGRRVGKEVREGGSAREFGKGSETGLAKSVEVLWRSSFC